MGNEFDEAQKEQLIELLTNELRVLRAKAEISQRELAALIGVSRQTYGLIENKKNRMTWRHFLPLLLLLTVVGALAMRGNPFFFQLRPGKKERVFRLIKFRTMPMPSPVPSVARSALLKRE